MKEKTLMKYFKTLGLSNEQETFIENAIFPYL